MKDDEKSIKRIDFSEGSDFVVEKGKEELYHSFDGSGVFTEQSFVENDSSGIEVSRRRTVFLGNYEFAKIIVGMSVDVDKDKKDKAFNEVVKVVNEVLYREVSNIKSIDRKNEEISLTSDVRRRKISIIYGWTFRAKIDNEFHGINVGLNEPISDSENLEAAFLKLQTDVGEKLRIEKSRVNKHEEDYGF